MEAEGELDHGRLEESLPILGPPLLNGPGPRGLTATWAHEFQILSPLLAILKAL